MKIISISLSVSLNLIAFALAAPITTTLQETGFAVDHTAYPLKARDIFGGFLQNDLGAVVDNLVVAPLSDAPGNTGPLDGGASGNDIPYQDDGALGATVSTPGAGEFYPDMDSPFALGSDPSMGATYAVSSGPYELGDYEPFK